MEYRIKCACGEPVTVAEAAAGTTTPCRCGRTIVIPSLRELRRQVGLPEPTVSPELEVEMLLLTGKLPEETACVLCGVATDGCVSSTTECERASVESGQPSWWRYLLGFVALGWLGVIVVGNTAEEDKEWGKDRIFPLPLRVCAACRERLTTPAEVKAALRRVPVYRRLLEKYPWAKVSLPGA